MFEFTDAQLALLIQQYTLPFFRIAAVLMTMPVIGTRIVSARIRVVLAFLVTIIVVPLLPPLNVTDSFSLQTIIYVIHEVLLGIAIGFAFQVVFQVFVLAGQFMAMKMGLGFASMNDPTSGVQTTALSQFYLMMVTLMFIAVNGHLVLLEMLISSFQSLPPSQFEFSQAKALEVVQLGSWLFASALVFAMPILTSLLIINIAFGVMSRAAPQLNIFAVGFPFTLICGMILVGVGLTTFSVNFDQVMDDGFIFMHNFLELK